MIVRFAWLFVLAALACVVTAVQIDREALRKPQMAAAVPDGLASFAAQQSAAAAVMRGDGAQALDRARRLVRKRPLPAEHLTLLAQAEALAGNETAALRAMEAAAGRGWREPFAQNAMAAAALNSGDKDIAAQRLSALWAIGFARERLGNLTRAMLATADGRAAFAQRLVAPGRWHSNFVTGAIELVPPEHLSDTIVRAREGGANLDCSALKTLALGLEGRARPALAARVSAGCA